MEQLQQAVAALPSRYQPIFQHEEYPLMDESSYEGCLDKIRKVYIALRETLGRPLRVLELGCAQGYNSLTVASWGAEVTGIDALAENIAVCRLLAKEHEDYRISFRQEKPENFASYVQSEEFDLALGLNVLHVFTAENAKDIVQGLLGVLAARVPAGIFEIPLKGEPFPWAENLSADYKEMLKDFRVVKTLMYQESPLSEQERPICFLSNSYLYFSTLGMLRLDPAEGTAEQTGVGRRQFSSEDKIVEYIDTRSVLGDIAEENKKEIHNGIGFLSDMGGRNGFPRIFALEENVDETWVVREKLQGSPLGEKLGAGDCDPWDVIRQTIRGMMLLDESGFCYREFGVWDVFYEEVEQKVYLTGYGDIERKEEDGSNQGKAVMSFLSFMCHVLDRGDEGKSLHSLKLLTHLKRHLSDRQYAELTKLRGNDICFRKLRDILFRSKGSDRPYEYNLRDLELMRLFDMEIETRRDWNVLKPALIDRINTLLEYRKHSADHINRLSRMVADQQERIRQLEERLKNE